MGVLVCCEIVIVHTLRVLYFPNNHIFSNMYYLKDGGLGLLPVVSGANLAPADLGGSSGIKEWRSCFLDSRGLGCDADGHD